VTPELKFIAACCRWPDDDERGRLIAEAATLVRDWNQAARLAEAHRVEGLVAHGLDSATVAIPAEVRGAIQSAADAIRGEAIAAIGEALRVTRAFSSRGIRHLVLKGLPIAILAYGTATLKHSIDLDLYVDKSDGAAACDLLRELGYANRRPWRALDAEEFESWSRVAKEAQFCSNRGVVDLHWGLIDQPALLPGVDPFEHVRTVELLPGHCVPALADSVHLAYLAAHGAMHGWSRLKWLADFSAFIAVRPLAAREALVFESRRFCPGRSIDQALLLVDDLFGSGLVPQDCNGNDPKVRQLVGNALQLISARTPHIAMERDPVTGKILSRSQWLLQPGLGYRLAEVRRRMIESEIRLRLRLRLPRAFHWFYWVLRGPGAIVASLWRAVLPRNHS
jgi:hypothetical protein